MAIIVFDYHKKCGFSRGKKQLPVILMANCYQAIAKCHYQATIKTFFVCQSINYSQKTISQCTLHNTHIGSYPTTNLQMCCSPSPDENMYIQPSLWLKLILSVRGTLWLYDSSRDYHFSDGNPSFSNRILFESSPWYLSVPDFVASHTTELHQYFHRTYTLWGYPNESQLSVTNLSWFMLRGVTLIAVLSGGFILS